MICIESFEADEELEIQIHELSNLNLAEPQPIDLISFVLSITAFSTTNNVVQPQSDITLCFWSSLNSPSQVSLHNYSYTGVSCYVG